MFSLDQRTALITGSGRGMGFGIAQTLAEQGANVVINDLYTDRAEQAASILRDQGHQAIAFTADVTDIQSIQALVAAVNKRWGNIDILINNAGIPADGMVATQFREMAIEEWDRYIDINLKGVLNCTKAVIDPMCDQGWGRIITVVSEGWRSSNGMGVSLYAAAKAGAVGFTRQLSGEIGRHGVTANCISLGIMDNVPNMEAAAKHFPIKRLGSASDAAAAAAYLASDEASWVTGQCLPINGGIITA
jgi:NAD(P)-dependent dehydrogenase (short-subunit alcohol dehydrogenase family)